MARLAESGREGDAALTLIKGWDCFRLEPGRGRRTGACSRGRARHLRPSALRGLCQRSLGLICSNCQMASRANCMATQGVSACCWPRFAFGGSASGSGVVSRALGGGEDCRCVGSRWAGYWRPSLGVRVALAVSAHAWGGRLGSTVSWSTPPVSARARRDLLGHSRVPERAMMQQRRPTQRGPLQSARAQCDTQIEAGQGVLGVSGDGRSPGAGTAPQKSKPMRARPKEVLSHKMTLAWKTRNEAMDARLVKRHPNLQPPQQQKMRATGARACYRGKVPNETTTRRHATARRVGFFLGPARSIDGCPPLSSALSPQDFATPFGTSLPQSVAVDTQRGHLDRHGVYRTLR